VGAQVGKAVQYVAYEDKREGDTKKRQGAFVAAEHVQ
jgi:hypothetical protein